MISDEMTADEVEAALALVRAVATELSATAQEIGVETVREHPLVAPPGFTGPWMEPEVNTRYKRGVRATLAPSSGRLASMLSPAAAMQLAALLSFEANGCLIPPGECPTFLYAHRYAKAALEETGLPQPGQP